MKKTQTTVLERRREIVQKFYADINATKELNQSQKQCLKIALERVAEENSPFAEAIDLPAGYLEMIYSQAYYLFMSGQYDNARLLFEVLCMIDSKDARFPFAVASCYHKTKHYGEAIKCYVDALVNDKNNPQTYYYLFDCFLHLGQKELAGGALIAALQLTWNESRFEKFKKQLELECVGFIENLLNTEIR